MKNIKKLDNYTLLQYYVSAIQDDHYNPTDKSYNTSGFNVQELEDEVYLRMEWQSYQEEEDGFTKDFSNL